MRRFHRVVAAVFGVFLTVTAVTGLLWAYAPYWKKGYMEMKNPLSSPPLTAAAVTAQEAMDRVSAHWKEQRVTIITVALRADFGRLLYEITGRVAGTKATLLLDAQTGEVLTPLTEALAVLAARQYLEDAPEVERVERLEVFKLRPNDAPRSAYAVHFQTPGRAEIVIDRDSGQILGDFDRVRRFHFLVMRLHQLNFFGFHKTLTVIPGAGLLLMVLSGTAIWIKTWSRRAHHARLRPGAGAAVKRNESGTSATPLSGCAASLGLQAGEE